jgi:hypothetical protein
MARARSHLPLTLKHFHHFMSWANWSDWRCGNCGRAQFRILKSRDLEGLP